MATIYYANQLGQQHVADDRIKLTDRGIEWTTDENGGWTTFVPWSAVIKLERPTVKPQAAFA